MQCRLLGQGAQGRDQVGQHRKTIGGLKADAALDEMNAAIREMTFNREPTQSIRRQARLLGMRTLLDDGVNKALRGITTLEEILSTCHHEASMVGG